MTIRASVDIPLRNGIKAEFVSFNHDENSSEPVALLFSGWKEQEYPLVRIHSECLTGDVFGSRRCDCNQQLNEAIDLMSRQGGIILYLRQEGRGIGLYNKLDAYNLQIHKGMDTFEANAHLGFPHDARDYKLAALMLKDLGVDNIRLLTNNQDKANGLSLNGIKITEIISTATYLNSDNVSYIQAKKKSGHKLAV